jgi:hypothetical protein
VCARNTFFLSLFLSFFLSAEPVGARNVVVLLSTNFRSRHRERHQVSVICALLLRSMDVSSDSQKDGFKIAMAHFVVPKLGFRKFLWWSCVRMSKALSLSPPLSLSLQDCSFFLLFPAGSVAAVSVFGVLLEGLSNVQKFLFS